MWGIGVDVGGTKIEAVALAADGREHGRRRVPSPRGDYDATLATIAGLVENLTTELGEAKITGVGIGIPGSLSPKSGLVRNANSTWLNGQPFERDMKARFTLPLTVQNDANCFALSEAWDGAGAGCGTVFGIILGTGVGGGIVHDGRLLLGRNAIAGEWGHNPLPWPGDLDQNIAPCFCGKTGCIETFLSGPSLERQYLAVTGHALDAKAIAEQAANGEPTALAVLDTYSERLARALASVVNIIDPDVIVFGGGVSNIPYILTRAREILPRWMFSDVSETAFKLNRWGDSSGVRGAARLGLSSATDA